MTMNKTYVGVALGLMCILLTSCIVIQLNTIKEATKIVGTSYAAEELREEVLRWKEEYDRAYKNLENKEQELEKARQNSSKDAGRTSELQKELDEANRLLGLTEVTGTGIILTLKDSEETIAKESAVDMTYTLIHDEDLRQMLKEKNI